MSEDHKRKARLLGMSFGAANGRLRKALLFKLVGQLGLANCYRCGLELDNIDDFSIEHMEDWMGSADPVKIFFDVDNIAFSHRSCNSAAGGGSNKMYGSAKERKAAQHQRWYKRNSTQFLARKRATYKKTH